MPGSCWELKLWTKMLDGQAPYSLLYTVSEVVTMNQVNRRRHFMVLCNFYYVCRRWSRSTSCCRTWIQPKTESCGWKSTTLVRFGRWTWTYRLSWPGISHSVFSITTHPQSPRTLLITLIQEQCMFRLLSSAHPLSDWNNKRKGSYLMQSGNSNRSKYQHVPSKF